MISQDNFVALLESLGFTKNKSIYSKTIGATSLSVDVTKQTIHYPESDGLVVNERQTCNFSANENFVVFECVHRLLEKGYKPEHIELEPKWKLGRGASGGRADILVKDNFGKPLLIIECKTAGTEFKKAWNKTLQDGDQPFRKGMVQLAVKSGGTNNINATKMGNIKVPVPSLAEQKKFVAKVEALEKQIADAQAVMDTAPARKEAVMK